jgi:transketolase
MQYLYKYPQAAYPYSDLVETNSGHIIGMQTFGASAPFKELPRKFGFEPDQVAAAAKEQLGRK